MAINLRDIKKDPEPSPIPASSFLKCLVQGCSWIGRRYPSPKGVRVSEHCQLLTRLLVTSLAL